MVIDAICREEVGDIKCSILHSTLREGYLAPLAPVSSLTLIVV